MGCKIPATHRLTDCYYTNGLQGLQISQDDCLKVVVSSTLCGTIVISLRSPLPSADGSYILSNCPPAPFRPAIHAIFS
jgi:hypothetical protein